MASGAALVVLICDNTERIRRHWQVGQRSRVSVSVIYAADDEKCPLVAARRRPPVRLIASGLHGVANLDALTSAPWYDALELSGPRHSGSVRDSEFNYPQA